MSVKVKLLRIAADGSEVYGLKINHNGWRKTISVGTKAAAVKARITAESELANGKLGKQPDRAQTLGDIAADWLASIKATKAPRTHSRYSAMVRMHLAESIKSQDITTVTRGDVRRELLRYHGGGASSDSVEMMHTVFSGIFGHAIDDELIATSPAAGLLKKLEIAKVSSEGEPFTEAEMHGLLSQAGEYRDFFFALWHTGSRVGEMIALQWADVNFTENKISITKTAKDQHIRKSTKTYLDRDIDMSDELATILMQRKRSDKVSALKDGRGLGQVFHKRGRLYSQQTLLRVVKRACASLGYADHTIHDIRHTTASMLCARGATIVYVQKMLGHSSPRITLDKYSKYMPSENAGMINLLTDKSRSVISSRK